MRDPTGRAMTQVRDTWELCACPHCQASFDWGGGTRTSVVRRMTCAEAPFCMCPCAAFAMPLCCRVQALDWCAVCHGLHCPAVRGRLRPGHARRSAGGVSSTPVCVSNDDVHTSMTPLIASFSEFRAVQRTLTRLETRSACTLARRRPARTRSLIHMLIH